MTLRTLSARNARVVRLGKLSARRRARETERAFVIDGPVLLDEALAAGCAVSEVFVDADRLDARTVDVIDRAEDAGAEVFGVGSDVLARVTDPVHPQSVAAIAQQPNSETSQDVPGTASAVLWLVGVADPGNAGTLVRAAVAAGFDAVAVSPGTVELFSPKTLRATAGALFHVSVWEFASVEAGLARCREHALELVATTLDGDEAYDSVDLQQPCAILIGNEAHGLDPEITAAASLRVQIPMAGPVESLNAAMAGTLMCFEVLRQRRGARDRISASPATNAEVLPR